ncbi:Nuclear autoantigenic sperm protein [Rhynchospora pubera]|uniref:Nuclear autoantigenic sperm protein n=1 Tax=Rhynchospora pubera TaxID=906938 RepID=A0AAV8BW11_9POAL|nr:Nuclear autoantigenic sperm protein [Rhynchospora pubera]KAJ4800838.1 Nuclear autoantigenic sperm protein [Rhynchospora pubera]
MATSDEEPKTLANETPAEDKESHVENPNSNGDGSNGVEKEGTNGTLAEEEEDANVENPDSNGDGSNGVEKDGTDGTLAEADELFIKGSKAIEEGDFNEAADCLSRALEIRVAHHGELAKECTSAYYKYGSALLFKAQEETDPLGNVPEKPATAEKGKSGIVIDRSNSSKSVESSSANVAPSRESKLTEGGEGSSTKGHMDVDDDVEEEDADADMGEEEESDLDLAWKMLDIARVIAEQSPEDTLEKVNIFSALAEVSMEREDLEMSLNDYNKALSMLERIVEPDHRRLVELNFRICLVLETALRIEEALPYCGKAISVCKSRIEKLKEKVAAPDAASPEESSVKSDAQDEMELLTGILSELETKLEDLEQAVSNQTSKVSPVMEAIKAAFSSDKESKLKLPETVPRSESLSSSQMGTIFNGFDSPTVSTAAGDSSGSTVTHLGVVGRGVKRAVVQPVSSDEHKNKKPLMDSSSENKD